MNDIDAFPLSFNDIEIRPGDRVIYYAPMEKTYLRWATIIEIEYARVPYTKDDWRHKIILRGDGSTNNTSTIYPKRIIVMHSK